MYHVSSVVSNMYCKFLMECIKKKKKNLPKYFILRRYTYTSRNDQPRFESVEKFSFFIVFKCSHDAVFSLCWLEFRFRNPPFSRSPVKTCAILCVNGRPIVHIFHHFQNMPASCSLRPRTFMWNFPKLQRFNSYNLKHLPIP